jgi:dTDP-4-dehydrorhamnose 3,5-epimerase
MIFVETDIEGAYRVEVEPHIDSRGYFAEAWTSEEFSENGLKAAFVQGNISRTSRAGTIRGLHYQEPPHQEAKLVLCTRGSIFAVFVDLRADSETYLRWCGVELSEGSLGLLYVPEGCAHGYQVLADGAQVYYQTTARYEAAAQRGIRFDDPLFEIEWLAEVSVVSPKDRAWPDFDPRRTHRF